MVNKNEYYNPKALNLDALEGKTSKVTLGFKCTPQLKIKLAEDAEGMGLTLSNYTETLIENAEELVEVKTRQEIKSLTQTIEQLREQINFYESPKLKTLFKDLENQSATYFTSDGNEVNITIRTIGDVFTVLVNSFKTTSK
jgi:hypothetical protein